MLDRILDALDPYIAELIIGVIMTYFGGVVRVIFRDKEAQKNLHTAVETGVDLVTDKLAGYVTNGSASTASMVDEIVAYVKRSVPGSVKTLKADDTVLQGLAKAKMNQRKIMLDAMQRGR